MTPLDAFMLPYAQPDIAALADRPKTYAATVPAWAGQVTTLPGPWTGAGSSELCNGRHVALAAYGQTGVRGTETFAYLWRRFGPPWWGCDDHKDLVGYLLHTPDPDVVLTLALSASTVPYAVGYLITKTYQAAWYAPLRAWNAQFQDWWHTVTLTEQERAALRMQAARGPGAAPMPLVTGLRQRYWAARQDEGLRTDAEAALGPQPRQDPHTRHPGIMAALHDALIECLRPVFVRDVAINILGHVPDDQVDDQEAAARSLYAGYGIPREALDALRADDKDETP